MSTLTVEIDDFVTAAKTMSDKIADPAGERLFILSQTLGGAGGMAGNDPGGQSWATGYDDAAWTVVRATGLVVNAAYRTAGMFGRSAMNYVAAESASTPDGSDSLQADVSQQLPGDTFVGDPARPPTANGSRSDDGPTGWWLVEHSVGYVWPNGDSDKLRAAANAWERCGNALSTNTCVITQAAAPFARHGLPEADDMMTVCQGFATRMGHLATAHQQLADACREYAEHLDKCHDEVRNELTWLLGESATLQAGGLIASIFSLGSAEVPVQAAQAGRVALAAKRITEFIRTFLEAVRNLGRGVKAIRDIAEDVRTQLQALGQSRLATAGVTPARGLPAIGRAGSGGLGAWERARMAMKAKKELAATQRLEKEAGFLPKSGRPGEVVSKESRTHILDGDGPNSGGHRWPGAPGKTPFPKNWNDDQIIDNVGDIVSSPSTQWRYQTGSGGMYTKGGDPAVWRAWEVRDGVRIRVAWEPATGRVRTAFPDNGPVLGELVP
ncbi:WXG100-like domain-containing protein [Jatrophihabitans fulvus]